MSVARHALVLGGYGLIGAACLRTLRAAGFRVTGIGRSATAARACAPDVDWLLRDIPTVTVAEWRAILADVDVVVNAAGALQDGAKDNLEAIHVTALSRLAEAAEGRALRLVQISAAGARLDASSTFFRSKARGDALVAGMADWVILRPTLVIAPEAYGGTALLRAAAALPLVLPRLLPRAEVQTVHVGDVAAAVVAAAEGRVASEVIADLTGPESWRFPALLARIRLWLGLPEARLILPLPMALLRAIGWVADLLGHLGWRSPLRSTALRALAEGITGDPATWAAAGGAPCRGLETTLTDLPATRQDRLFARMFLALPLAIGLLSLFWLTSGLIALAWPAAASEVLTTQGLGHGSALLLVLGGALADIGLGAAILWRRAARHAALGMAALSVIYMLSAAWLAPALWLDPLGPMVKVLPGLMLALIVWLVLEER